ncbi:DNA binding protein [Gordonia phage Fairfaxidum]|uniref:Uncharacterized protein n=1 Tax=Gordonia phage Fairfaxidum TaxID=2572526 RepID=A0A4D6T6I3_9CAUD|nr:DNA binding protein [Gordonia phage Fairfaxidum]QCG77659.1 hypothetical protein SEA_FAIRFAXIDUM_76 [Gordonia phage Fairfaxidum]
MSRDIVDEIDALIDAQLAGGEDGQAQRAAAADRRCGHCNRSWHGLAITARMEEMRREYAQRAADAEDRGEEPEYASSAILGDYRYADDDSAVLCPGSEFIGPLTADMVEANQCQCYGCRIVRANRAARLDGAYPSPMYPAEMQWPVMRDPLNPAPWVIYRTDDYRTEPARWWRLDLTGHRHLDEIEVAFETEGLTMLRSVVGLPARHSLIMRVVDGGRTLSGITALDRDSDTGNVAHQTADEDGRPLTLDVHAARPHDLGGAIVWHEIDGPGGNYVHSRAVQVAARIDRWFDDHGLWFLAPRELRSAADRMLDAVGAAPWMRDVFNRWIGNAQRPPYAYGGVIPQGTRVGVDLGDGNTATYTVADHQRQASGSYELTLDDPSPEARRALLGGEFGQATLALLDELRGDL